jgi:ribonuclease-3 family protein
LKPTEYSAQTLAYLGDAVFELRVREMITEKNAPAGKLTRLARSYVSAKAQSKMYHMLEDKLSEEELAAMRRGRNLNAVPRSKNADMSEYRLATGLGALFGYLYISGSEERIKEVFEICANSINRQSGENRTGTGPAAGI